MRPLLAQGLGMLMLAQLDPVIGVFKDGCVSNAPTQCWDTDYYNEPGWVDTVERYRKIEYDRRNIHQDAAYNDMVPIATYMFFAVPLAFVVVSLLMWYFTGKEASALHDYVISHHQDADWVDEHSGVKSKLEERHEHQGRVGLGQHNEAADELGLEYMGRVEGRFSRASHVQTGQGSEGHKETLKEKLEKKKLHAAHVKSHIERAFEAVDTDGSGELTRDELKQLLKNMREPHTDAEIDQLMVKFDPDGSGSIDFNEFRDGWQSEYRKANTIAAFTGAENVKVFDKVVAGSKKAARDNLKVAETK